MRFFERLLGGDRLLTDPEECESYNIDFPKTLRGEQIWIAKFDQGDVLGDRGRGREQFPNR